MVWVWYHQCPWPSPPCLLTTNPSSCKTVILSLPPRLKPSSIAKVWLAFAFRLYAGRLGAKGVTWKTVAPGLPIPTGDHVVGGLAYNSVAGGAYIWFWDCGNVVRSDAIWRCDLVLPPNPTN